MKTKTLGEIAALIQADLIGDPQTPITGISTLQAATAGQLSFLDNPKYQRYLPETKASAVILTSEAAADCPCAALVVKDPYFAYAKVATAFSEVASVPTGIHPSAVIGKDCHIDSSASIAPQVVIEDRVTIGPRTQIGPGCVIGEGAQIGEACRLWANVTIYHSTRIGNRVVIHSGVVIGSDGFGMAKHEGAWHKIPQLGRVILEDDVEIGANTTIDRGALDNTIIGTGAKLDNQIQIGHNVVIGAHTVMAGCTGVAGSTKIGKHCMIGGGSCINGHIEITDNVMMTGMAAITNSIKEPGVYSSGTGFMSNREWRKNAARFRQLDKITRRLTELEKRHVTDEENEDDY